VGARLVHMSTDMVFAGRAADYTEADPPDAVLDYGRWKAEAEAAVADACPEAVLVRASLLYGTGRSSRAQEDVADVLAGRKAMRFFTDEYRCPTHAADVAAALVQVAG
ncbi:MAG: sugar nucleotide-binding protein, partial [Ilumatobacter sp.]|nr:sugar nucleotide-binding protein [Ilumatobacter sp.]